VLELFQFSFLDAQNAKIFQLCFLGTSMCKNEILVHISIIPIVKILKNAIEVFQSFWLLNIWDKYFYS
jgi:hypothetical protein